MLHTNIITVIYFNLCLYTWVYMFTLHYFKNPAKFKVHLTFITSEGIPMHCDMFLFQHRVTTIHTCSFEYKTVQ